MFTQSSLTLTKSVMGLWWEVWLSNDDDDDVNANDDDADDNDHDNGDECGG